MGVFSLGYDLNIQMGLGKRFQVMPGEKFTLPPGNTSSSGRLVIVYRDLDRVTL